MRLLGGALGVEGAGLLCSALSSSAPLAWYLDTEALEDERLARYPDLRLYRETGDAKALNRFLVANRGLATFFAMQYLRRAVNAAALDREEIFAAALRGLWKAAEKYDPARASFSRAAFWWTRDAMSRVAMRTKVEKATRYYGAPSEVRLRQARARRAASEEDETSPESTGHSDVDTILQTDPRENEVLAHIRLDAAIERARLDTCETAFVMALIGGNNFAKAVSLAELTRKEAYWALERLERAWRNSA